MRNVYVVLKYLTFDIFVIIMLQCAGVITWKLYFMVGDIKNVLSTDILLKYFDSAPAVRSKVTFVTMNTGKDRL